MPEFGKPPEGPKRTQGMPARQRWAVSFPAYDIGSDVPTLTGSRPTTAR